MSSLSEFQREILLAELGGLRKFCLSLTGNVADADDLLQTTVEKILEKGMPEDAHAAKAQYIDELDNNEVAFRAGYLSAYHDVISTLQSQATVFDIPFSLLELDDIQPEQELLALINRS